MQNCYTEFRSGRLITATPSFRPVVHRIEVLIVYCIIDIYHFSFGVESHRQKLQQSCFPSEIVPRPPYHLNRSAYLHACDVAIVHVQSNFIVFRHAQVFPSSGHYNATNFNFNGRLTGWTGTQRGEGLWSGVGGCPPCRSFSPSAPSRVRMERVGWLRLTRIHRVVPLRVRFATSKPSSVVGAETGLGFWTDIT